MVWFGVMSLGSGLAVDHEPSPIRPHPFEPTASRHTFSKVISIVAFCSKRTRLLTVRKQNLQKKNRSCSIHSAEQLYSCCDSADGGLCGEGAENAGMWVDLCEELAQAALFGAVKDATVVKGQGGVKGQGVVKGHEGVKGQVGVSPSLQGGAGESLRGGGGETLRRGGGESQRGGRGGSLPHSPARWESSLILLVLI